MFKKTFHILDVKNSLNEYLKVLIFIGNFFKKRFIDFGIVKVHITNQ